MDSYSDALTAAALVITSGALIGAAWSDVRHYLIPNRMPAAIALSYLLALPGMGWSVWLAGVATALVAFGVGAFLFARQWVGGGDVKLATATILWAGPLLLADFVTMVSISGVVMAAVMVALPKTRAAGPGEAQASALATRLNQPMAFGVPLAVGGLWIVALQITSLAYGGG